MSWGNDHDHRGEYAADSHYHYVGDIHDAAEKYHDHAGTYSHVGHDHDQSYLWSTITDLQNSLDGALSRIAALEATAAAQETQGSARDGHPPSGVRHG